MSDWEDITYRTHLMLIKENDYDPFFIIDKYGDWKFLKPPQLKGSTIIGLMDRYSIDFVYDILDEIYDNVEDYKTRWVIKQIIKELNGI